MKLRELKIGIIGAGRVGSNLAYFLSQAGWHIGGIYDINTDAAKALADAIPSGVHSSVEMLAQRCEILFIATPDKAIIDTAQIISEIKKIKAKYIFHTCGALSSDVLKCAGCEFEYASIHPAIPVPKLDKKINPFKGALWSVEGTVEANELGRVLVESLKSRFFIIKPEDKITYHTACALLSNNIFALLQSGYEIFESIGITPEIAKDLVGNLSGNAVRNFNKDGMDALTGPIIRNDINTLLEHFYVLNSLKEEKHIILYLETLRNLPNSKYIIKLVNQLYEKKES